MAVLKWRFGGNDTVRDVFREYPVVLAYSNCFVGTVVAFEWKLEWSSVLRSELRVGYKFLDHVSYARDVPLRIERKQEHASIGLRLVPEEDPSLRSIIPDAETPFRAVLANAILI